MGLEELKINYTPQK